MKFLVDECLSPELTRLARARGYGDSTHVVWLGLSGSRDWELKDVILADDWTFVTKNSVDFRGPNESPGSKGQYADVAIHAGLICLNGPPGMDLDMQLELFERALDLLQADDDLVNHVSAGRRGHNHLRGAGNRRHDKAGDPAENDIGAEDDFIVLEDPGGALFCVVQKAQTPRN